MATESFFEFRARVTSAGRPARKAAPPAAAATGPTTPQAVSVSELTSQIDRAIRAGLPAHVLVRGEVSNVNLHRQSGHLYFTLKDASACIDCVMFRSEASRLKFQVSDGMELIAGGRVQIYSQRGRYQLYATSLQPVGQGALELALQQLRKKLEAEGLFSPERKRELPAYPRRIALVTSRSTAALQDMLKVLRRFPFLDLMLYHVPVQGDGSAEQIAQALDDLSRNRQRLGIDVILLARGGGSLEDLWEFNEEIVARAMARCSIPIVTGIGHEIDVSIADLVADYHAHTPTEAAQVVTANWRLAKEVIDDAGLRLRRALKQCLADARQRLAHLQRHELFRRPADLVHRMRQRLDDRQRSLALAMGRRVRVATQRISTSAVKLQGAHPAHQLRLRRQALTALDRRLARAMQVVRGQYAQRVDRLRTHLKALNPELILQRGYSITVIKKTGEIVKAASQVKGGEKLVTKVADGVIESIAKDPRQRELFE